MQKDVKCSFLQRFVLPTCWNSFLSLQHTAEHVPEVKDQGLLNPRLHSPHAFLSKEKLKKTSLVQGTTGVIQACSCYWPQAAPGEELLWSRCQILQRGSCWCCSLCQLPHPSPVLRSSTACVTFPVRLQQVQQVQLNTQQGGSWTVHGSTITHTPHLRSLCEWGLKSEHCVLLLCTIWEVQMQTESCWGLGGYSWAEPMPLPSGWQCPSEPWVLWL